MVSKRRGILNIIILNSLSSEGNKENKSLRKGILLQLSSLQLIIISSVIQRLAAIISLGITPLDADYSRQQEDVNADVG